MIHVRRYGTAGPPVVVLHGGPGAPGDAAGLAQALGDRFQVLEPLQRRSGGEPLTVARHVEDLRALLEAEALEAPALVGHSWGALLALAFAAEHPERARALVLVASGTFDHASRREFHRRLDERLGPAGAARLAALQTSGLEPDEALARAGALLHAAYAFDAPPPEPNPLPCDALGNAETWSDMIRAQDEGVYPAELARIICPVVMLHGAEDPHPGRMIRDSLVPVLPQLEYVEFPRCGHYPWRERHARDVFLTGLKAWLLGTLGER